MLTLPSAAQGERAACTIQCLCAGCTYRVRVRARNASGYSAYSGAADAATAPDRPLAPQPPMATARSASSISVFWAPPEHDRGSPVTSYRLELCRGVPPLYMPCCTKHCCLYLLQKGENSKC